MWFGLLTQSCCSLCLTLTHRDLVKLHMKFLGGFKVGAFEGTKPLSMFVAQGMFENLNYCTSIFFFFIC